MDVSLINAFMIRKAIRESLKLPLFKFKLDVAAARMYSEKFAEPLSRAVAVFRAVVPRAANGDPICGPTPTDAIRLYGMNHWLEEVAKVPRCCRVAGCMLRSTY